MSSTPMVRLLAPSHLHPHPMFLILNAHPLDETALGGMDVYITALTRAVSAAG
jgi:hypothetical protein